MYIRTDYKISLCPAIRLAGGRSAENGPNLRQIQVATTSNRLYVIYYELITTLSRLLSETLVMSYANGRRRAIRLPEALKRSNTANAELPLPLIWTQGTGCSPATGSTAGSVLGSCRLPP